MIRQLLLALLLPALALAAPDADRIQQARNTLADALLLESGMGDYEGARDRYQQLLDSPEGLPEGIVAEACMRLGMAHERLNEPDKAEEAYEKVLREHADTSWTQDARHRLRSLDEDRKQVQALPVAWDFEEGLGGLFHARNRAQKGRLAQERPVDGLKPRGVASWRSYVTGGEDDLVVVGFNPELTVRGHISLQVKALNFPAHLVFVLVQGGGGRFSSAATVVRPEQGWQTVALGPSDFIDRSRDPEDRVFVAQDGITYMMVQDITGYSSTDRGENVVLLDDLAVR